MDRKKIAIIGSGISGLGAAWLLRNDFDVTVYEQNDYVGGHSNTQTVETPGGPVSIDTGFMVMNHKTYPNLVELFKVLNISLVKTDMSFGVYKETEDFQFISNKPIGRVHEIFRPRFWRMITDILYFNNNAELFLLDHGDTEYTLAELCQKLSLSEAFMEYYLLPMTGAIWSAESKQMSGYSARLMVEFLSNHGLLNPKSLNPFSKRNTTVQWYTLKNGSIEYVQKIVNELEDSFHINRGVTNILSQDDKILVTDVHDKTETYDYVICAGHPNQTRSFLEKPTQKQTQILKAFTYSTNEMYVHRDTSFMLPHGNTWPSWTSKKLHTGTELSYYMNNLQHKDEQYPLIVTLNPSTSIAKEDILYKTIYEHPIFNLKTAHAQKNLDSIQGVDNIFFAGAWTRHGFHEDGLLSAINIAKKLGVTIPWEKQ